MATAQNMDRRSFLGALGAVAAAAAMPSMALAEDASSLEDGEGAQQAALRRLTDDMQTYRDRGGTSLTVEELNRIRHERVDAAGDFVREDGTVIPAVWNKINVLTYTYGIGMPDPAYGEALDYIMCLFENDEEAGEHYLEMPFGKVFTALEYAQESGRPYAECKEICEDLANRYLLYRVSQGEHVTYFHNAIAHGFFELAINRLYDPEYVKQYYESYLFAPHASSLVGAGTPIYYSVPCDKEIVVGEKILPLNDYKTVLESHEKFAVLPCCCSLREDMRLGGDVPELLSDAMREYTNEHCDHRLERCLCLGEEAEFYIECGVGREITRDEADAILRRNIDDGLIVQMGYQRNANIICSCHGDCCGVLSVYLLEGVDAWNASATKDSCSDYLLDYNKDACIQCGACISRCPMGAVEFDEDGFPAVTGICVRCGQCGLTCPASARKLFPRPEGDRMTVPDNHMDDSNRKFGYRLEHGLA